MTKELTLSLIGGGNMATALATGLIGKRCAAHDVHVIDPNESVRAAWQERGTTVAATPDAQLAGRRVWIFAVKPQHMKETVLSCRPFIQPETLVVSIAAGITGTTIAGWLGTPERPWLRAVRCMPNTPALIGEGITGMMALSGVSEDDKALAQQLLRAVGEVVWVESDQALDAVTALSGSGPAYVFLFLEALIQGAKNLGLSDQQSRQLALATLHGSTQLAALSPEPPATLRERVTSKGGTTAAALAVFEQRQFAAIVGQAMLAASGRAAELAIEYAK
ncbi:pyrroline-5-carboxylate reductase [Paralcaligenes ginsengisoli]|jgi:pyrroline-5-carboxylate reductase